MALYDLCKKIPIYPAAIKLEKNLSSNIPAHAPICEGERGEVSFLSAEHKENYLKALMKGGNSRNWNK